jgi:SAM-dependent methyltransferase
MPLAYYSRAASREFWSEHWAGEDVQALVDIARRSPLTSIIEGALPVRGRMLEAGCGLGQYVVLLRERGRAIAGVDWSLDALGRCRAAAPGTPLAAMDLAALGVQSAALDAYVSLGVVEHDAAGPDAILAEAARVLAPGGRLLLSVPYWNGVRRLCAPHLVRQARRTRAGGGEFHQFAFSRREIRGFVESHGFRVLSFHPYDPARMPRKALGQVLARLRRGGAPGRGGAETSAPGRDEPAGAWRGQAASAAGQSTDPARGKAVGRAAGDGANAAPVGTAIDGAADAIRAALKRLAYTPPSLRLFAHMILAVAVRR